MKISSVKKLRPPIEFIKCEGSINGTKGGIAEVGIEGLKNDGEVVAFQGFISEEYLRKRNIFLLPKGGPKAQKNNRFTCRARCICNNEYKISHFRLWKPKKLTKKRELEIDTEVEKALSD